VNKLQDHYRNRFLNRLIELCETHEFMYTITDTQVIVEIGE